MFMLPPDKCNMGGTELDGGAGGGGDGLFETTELLGTVRVM